MVGKRPHRSAYILPSLVMLGSTVVQHTTFVLILSSRSVLVVFYLFGCNPYLFMCKCRIVVFLDFSRCFLISFSVRPGRVFRKPRLVALRRPAVVGLKISAYKYLASSGIEVFSECCSPNFLIVVAQGALPTFLFLLSGPFDYFFSVIMEGNCLFI